MLEDIIEVMNSTPLCVDNSNTKKDAIACRDKAMTTWAKAGESKDVNSDSDDETNSKKKPRRVRKRYTSDVFQFLALKASKESELQKEELELKRQKLELQAQQQKEQFTLQQEQLKQMM